MSSRTAARPAFTCNRWRMRLTTATLCQSKYGIARTVHVPLMDLRSAARRAAPPHSTGPRGNTYDWLSRIGAGYNIETPTVVKAKYRGAGPIGGIGGKCIDDAGAGTNNGTPNQLFTCNGTSSQNWTWNSGDGTLRALGKCMDVSGGATANGTLIDLWDCNGTGAQEWRWRDQTAS